MILDRYIWSELAGPFVFGILAFTAILAGSTVLYNLVDDAIRLGIPFSTVSLIFLLKVPHVLVLACPMSTLLATIVGFGRLSSDGEMLALRASGVSFYRLILPVVLFGVVISLGTILMNEGIVPKSAHTAETVFRQFTQRQRTAIKENVNFTEYQHGKPVRLVNVGRMDGSLFQSITVAEYENGDLTRLIRAKEGSWTPDSGWEFRNGVMHSFSAQDVSRLTVVRFESEIIALPVNPSNMAGYSKKMEEMTSRELSQAIAQQRRLGQDPITDIMNYHLKWSVPFASLIFALLGTSVGLRPHRSRSAMGLGVSLLVILVYYVLLSLGSSLGINRVIPPLVAAWFPNALVGVVAMILLHRLTGR